MLDPDLNVFHGVLPVGGHELSGAAQALSQPMSAAEAFWFDGYGVPHHGGVALYGHESSGKPHSAKG